MLTSRVTTQPMHTTFIVTCNPCSSAPCAADYDTCPSGTPRRDPQAHATQYLLHPPSLHRRLFLRSQPWHAWLLIPVTDSRRATPTVARRATIHSLNGSRSDLEPEAGPRLGVRRRLHRRPRRLPASPVPDVVEVHLQLLRQHISQPRRKRTLHDVAPPGSGAPRHRERHFHISRPECCEQGRPR